MNIWFRWTVVLWACCALFSCKRAEVALPECAKACIQEEEGVSSLEISQHGFVVRAAGVDEFAYKGSSLEEALAEVERLHKYTAARTTLTALSVLHVRCEASLPVSELQNVLSHPAAARFRALGIAGSRGKDVAYAVQVLGGKKPEGKEVPARKVFPWEGMEAAKACSPHEIGACAVYALDLGSVATCEGLMRELEGAAQKNVQVELHSEK